jgi:hypothetical protein
MAFSPCLKVLLNMQNQLDYIEDVLPVVYAPLSWQLKGYSQTSTGYGSKLTTANKVLYAGKLYRVYCACFGNAGSSFIISKGKRLFLRQN